MINFLLWTMPLLGISLIVVPTGLILMVFIASLFGEKHAERATIFMIVAFLIWGIWIGAYHLYPVVYSHNNLCPNGDVAGYCK
jgi:ABC-type anion transport system duplicated permease subunit